MSEFISPRRSDEDRQVLRPRRLFDGARIALVAPAGPVDPDRLEASCERCRSLGLEPVVYPSASARDGFLAGPDAARLDDLRSAFDDPAIDGVWALRGGYGTLRILDGLDLSRQLSDPIPFLGFSDNTTIHVRHCALGVVSFHGPHPGGPWSPETEHWLRRVLFTAEAPGLVPSSPSGEDPPRCLRPGRATGTLWGGNLSLLAALCGSTESLSSDGRILFVEDVAEPAYRVDRLMVQLERAGVLRGVAGLAFGRFTNSEAADSDEVERVLRDFADRLDVPAVSHLPFGHVEHNAVIPLGVRAVLDADERRLTIVEAAVRGDL